MSDRRRARTPRTWRDAQIVQLTLVRFREFLREPEALFWVFIFPVLLTAGLGLAFRSKPEDTAIVAVVMPAQSRRRRTSGALLAHVEARRRRTR